MRHHEILKYQTVTVALFVQCFTWSARRVYQTEASLRLPYVLAVCCETEQRN